MGLENAVNLLAVTSIDYSVRLEENPEYPTPREPRGADYTYQLGMISKKRLGAVLNEEIGIVVNLFIIIRSAWS
jgi:hypothetical protein